jgi:hypothetical protein
LIGAEAAPPDFSKPADPFHGPQPGLAAPQQARNIAHYALYRI